MARGWGKEAQGGGNRKVEDGTGGVEGGTGRWESEGGAGRRKAARAAASPRSGPFARRGDKAAVTDKVGGGK